MARSERAAEVVAEVTSAGLAALLGSRATPGMVAGVWCLPSAWVRDLAVSAHFDVPGWEVFGVVSPRERGTSPRLIAADAAVEKREAKGDPLLLLVDVTGAGAGTDGIYSAARIIKEGELLGAALSEGRARLGRDLREWFTLSTEKARREARLRSRSVTLLDLEYLAAIVADPSMAGPAVADLALWPIRADGVPTLADLNGAVTLADRLFPRVGVRPSVEDRVAPLLLADPDDARRLVGFLRGVDALDRRTAIQAAREHPDLWLNAIRPRLEAEQRLAGIELVPWRVRGGRPLAWTGLGTIADRNQLEFALFPADARRAAQRQLEVRWRALPARLPEGAATYEVEIRTGEGVLESKTLTHRGRLAYERAVFTFDDLDDRDILVEATVVVRPLAIQADGGVSAGPEAREVETEDFLIRSGVPDDAVVASPVGPIYATLSVALAHLAADRAQFEGAFHGPEPRMVLTEPEALAKNAFLGVRLDGKKARVPSSPLVASLAKEWATRHDGALGRWQLTVRVDGSAVGSPTFIPISDATAERTQKQRDDLRRASRNLAKRVSECRGPSGVVHLHGVTTQSGEYVEEFDKALGGLPHACALVQTLEVVTTSGASVGLIVLPTHPLRVAWQQAFDSLVAHARYEQDLPAKGLDVLVTAVTGTQVPAMLPGPADAVPMVFGASLGLQAVAMVRSDDPEPEATVVLLHRVLGVGETALAPAEGTSKALADPLTRYMQVRPELGVLSVHALHAGTARAVTRALGKALAAVTPPTDEDDASAPPNGKPPLRVELNLFPVPGRSTDGLGQHITEAAGRQRKGSGGIEPEDLWLLDSVPRPGGVTLPRLRWARRADPEPMAPAHVSIAFNLFATTVEYVGPADLPESKGVRELYGLVVAPARAFSVTGTSPQWVAWVPREVDGDRHPVHISLTRRLESIHHQILTVTAQGAAIASAPGRWPRVVTRVDPEQVERLQHLHRLSDWVITADRHASVEYFDSPRELPAQHDLYVIDTVPEYDDLERRRLITSTMHVDELIQLLWQQLGRMELSVSPENARMLLGALKSISGRLAMRLAPGGTVVEELTALAQLQLQSRATDAPTGPWLSLRNGFIVPLDDVRTLLWNRDGARRTTPADANGETAATWVRADLLYVKGGPRGGLTFTLVEVKYRQSLHAARGSETIRTIADQLEGSRRQWVQRFGPTAPHLHRVVARLELARVLRFYAQKARRYGLDDTVYEHMVREFRNLAATGDDGTKLEVINGYGFVYCPEYRAAEPDEISGQPDNQIWLAGPRCGPDARLTRPLNRFGGATVEQGHSRADRSPDPLVPGIGPVRANGTNGTGGTTGSKAPGSAGGTTAPGAPTSLPTPVGDGTGIANSGPAAFTAPVPTGNATTTPAPEPEPPSRVPALAADGGVVLGYREGSGTPTPVIWQAGIKANPHLMILGLPGMGKTTSLVNICDQLQRMDIVPIIFSYHDDIDESITKISAHPPRLVSFNGLGYNPLRVIGESPFAFLDNIGEIRDIFSAIYPGLGDMQLRDLRGALKQSYTDRGWSNGSTGLEPPFRSFVEGLSSQPKADPNLKARLAELDDYGFFSGAVGDLGLLEGVAPTLVQIHATGNEAVQRGFSTFLLYALYQSMFRRGVQTRITHAVVFDEAHRASRLKLIPRMIKECRKYGIAFVLASQEARDFDAGVFTGIANFLTLRVNEDDATRMGKIFVQASNVRAYADQIKQLAKYHAIYYGEQVRAPIRTTLIERYPPEA